MFHLFWHRMIVADGRLWTDPSKGQEGLHSDRHSSHDHTFCKHRHVRPCPAMSCQPHKNARHVRSTPPRLFGLRWCDWTRFMAYEASWQRVRRRGEFLAVAFSALCVPSEPQATGIGRVRLHALLGWSEWVRPTLKVVLLSRGRPCPPCPLRNTWPGNRPQCSSIYHDFRSPVRSVRSLLVVRPGAPSSFLFLVAMPGASTKRQLAGKNSMQTGARNSKSAKGLHLSGRSWTA